MGPRWAQHSATWPNMPQHGPDLAQHKPKLGARWLNMGPTWPNMGTTCAQHTPKLHTGTHFWRQYKGQPQPNRFVLAPSKPSWTKGTRPRTMELEGITMLILHLKSYIEYVLCVRFCANKDLQYIRRQYHVSVGTAISRDSCRKRTAEDLKQEAIDNVVTPSLPQPAIRPTKNG